MSQEIYVIPVILMEWELTQLGPESAFSLVLYILYIEKPKESRVI